MKLGFFTMPMHPRRLLFPILLAACVNATAAESIPRPTPEAGPLEKRMLVVPQGTPVWIVGSSMADLDVMRTERGEIFLAAGKSLILIDPSEPSLHVEVRARHNEPLYLGSIISRSRQHGIYAGLAGQRGQASAGTAVEGPNGVIVFKMVPDGPLERGPVAAARARVDAVKDAPAVKLPEPPTAIASQAPAPERRESIEVRPAVPPVTVAPPVRAPAEKIAVLEPKETAAQPARPVAERASHEDAMQKLLERQGRGVGSVSELTRVHPAVDLLRRLQ